MRADALYKKPEEMQEKIDEYFLLVEPKIVMDKAGRTYNMNHRRPCVAGLAHALGFASEQSLLDYSKKDADFAWTIARAKLRIKEHLVESTENGEAGSGVIWNLRCNWGWKPEEADEKNQPNEQVIRIIKDRGGRRA